MLGVGGDEFPGQTAYGTLTRTRTTLYEAGVFKSAVGQRSPASLSTLSKTLLQDHAQPLSRWRFALSPVLLRNHH